MHFREFEGALLYGASPVYALGETEHPGRLNVWGVASLHSEQGTAPRAPLYGDPLKAKGFRHAFCLFNCLTNTALSRGFFCERIPA